MPRRSIVTALLVLAAMAASAHDAHADETSSGAFTLTTDCLPAVVERVAPPRRKDWRFHIAPYGWLAGNQGQVVTNGQRVTPLNGNPTEQQCAGSGDNAAIYVRLLEADILAVTPGDYNATVTLRVEPP